MTDTGNSRLSPEEVAVLAGIAGLRLSEERVSQLAPRLRSLREGVEMMSELPLGEIEPATPRLPGGE